MNQNPVASPASENARILHRALKEGRGLDEALDLAIAAGDCVSVRRLAMRFGQDALAAPRPDGWNALSLAIDWGRPEVACLLIDLGLDPDTEILDQGPVLLWAITQGPPALAVRLLCLGANPRASDASGWSALHQAAAQGDDAMIVALLRAGADIDAVDAHGWSVLHEAVAHGHLDAVLHLCQHGADPNRRDLYGESPLDAAAMCPNPRVGPALRSHTL